MKDVALGSLIWKGCWVLPLTQKVLAIGVVQPWGWLLLCTVKAEEPGRLRLSSCSQLGWKPYLVS